MLDNKVLEYCIKLVCLSDVSDNYLIKPYRLSDKSDIRQTLSDNGLSDIG